MQEHPFTLTSLDEHVIAGTLYRPATPTAVMVIAHGMAEHAGRYADFARWLAERNIAVLTYDHRGHGAGCAERQRGFYSADQGWAKVTDDLFRVLRHSRATLPGLPVVLLGHSMGSFIAQSCVQQHPESVDSLILSATNRIARFELQLSGLLIGAIHRVYGATHRSPTIARMTFGKFNRRFRPNRTDGDWLSRDPAQVDAYLADPLCGFECTTGLWRDFIRGLLTIDPGQWRKDLPVHLFGGTDDPVGEMGAGLTRHFQAIRDAGIERVSLRLFDGGRHEMLNEVNRDEVREFVLSLCPTAAPQAEATAGAA